MIQSISHPLDHVGLQARGGRRLCGAGRTAGSIYLECGLFLGGTPIEQYLKDPPERFQPAQFGITPRGVHLITTPDGTTHVVDWVGSDSYPYPADFIEEARTMGVSRKIAKTADLSLIGKNSFLILIHARGSMSNMEAVSADTQIVCPNMRHAPGERCCALHWVIPDSSGTTLRQEGGVSYPVVPRLTGMPEAQYVPGIFMAVPISAISVVKNHDGTVDEQAWRAASRSGFDPSSVDY